MYIQKLVIKNFKKLRDITVELNEKINIIVGDNETGKSTILDAIYLTLTCQVNGRNIRNELTPYFKEVTKMSSQLPSGFAERIRILKSILDEVYPRSFDEWVKSFEVDGNPEQELLIWERITLTYSTFVESRPLAIEAKKEVMNILLQCSMGMADENIQSKRKVLHEAAVQSLLTLYRASAEATCAVDNGRQASY